MASTAPDAAPTATEVSSTDQTAPGPSTPNAAAPIAVEPAVAATTSESATSKPLGLTDEMLREVMKTRGIDNASMLQECLAADPYKLKLSYEVLRRRVKQLHEDTAKTSDGTSVDNSLQEGGETTKQGEKKRLAASDAEEKSVVRTAEQKDGEKKKKAKEQDHEAVARDLDMLADTVRSIVTHVVGSDDQENEDAATSELADVGDMGAVLKPVLDTRLDGEASFQAAAPAANDPSSILDAATRKSAGISTTAPASVLSESAKRPAVYAAYSPKRPKRAEYSEETRALCVRRHEEEGASYAVIAKELNIPHDTVRAIVRRAKRTGTVTSARRSGRPRKTSEIIDKVILEAVKVNKRCSAKTIQEELLRVFDVKVSPETVRRRVLEHTKQRLQYTTGGIHEQSLSPSVEEGSNAEAGNMALDAPMVPLLGGGLATNAALLDPVTFQQLLQQPTADTVQTETSSASTTSPARTTEVQPSAGASTTSSSSVMDDGEVSEDTPPAQSEELSASQPRRKRHKRAEYSLEVREQCVALHAQGEGYRKIGKSLQMPHTTVRAIVEKAQRTGSVLPAKRSGRPRKTDAIVDKVILQTVKNNQKSSARMIQEQLLETFGVRVSCETIRRRVKDHSLQTFSAVPTSSASIPDSTPTTEPNTTVQQPHYSDQELVSEVIVNPRSLAAFDNSSRGVQL